MSPLMMSQNCLISILEREKLLNVFGGVFYIYMCVCYISILNYSCLSMLSGLSSFIIFRILKIIFNIKYFLEIYDRLLSITYVRLLLNGIFTFIFLPSRFNNQKWLIQIHGFMFFLKPSWFTKIWITLDGHLINICQVGISLGMHLMCVIRYLLCCTCTLSVKSSHVLFVISCAVHFQGTCGFLRKWMVLISSW